MKRLLLRFRDLRLFTFGLLATAFCVAGLPNATAQEKKLPSNYDQMVDGVGGVEQVSYINKQIEKAWEENKITPSERCDDFTFIRRASLDLIGRIATPKEISKFLSDPARKRRSMLIERLLASPEFGSHMANTWAVLMLTRSGVPQTQQTQFRQWLMDHFNNPKADWSKIVTEILTAEGVTNENPAVNFILAHLGERLSNKEQGKYGEYDMVPVTSRTTKLFLGLQTQCVQCHDHPFGDKWGQHHFWGVNAFFRQVRAPRGRPMVTGKNKNLVQQFELKEDDNQNPRGLVPYERRSAVVLFTNARFLDGTKLKPKVDSRREELAEMITESPYFGKVYVNRMWYLMFGRSFTRDKPDDFGVFNPPSHPELMDKLAKDWTESYNHNPKDVLRWICNSRAYGLTTTANKTNDTPDAEAFFSRMLLKPMSPEQLFDSLMTATAYKKAQSKTERAELRQEWLDKLVQNFGNDEGIEVTFNGTVLQALMLMNGQEINQAIMDKENGTVANVIKKYSSARGTNVKVAMDALFLASLNRLPTKAEYAKILTPKMYVLPRVKAKVGSPEFLEGFYQDMFWALLNSNEFFLNH